MAVATTMISYGGFLGACGWYGAHTSGAMHSLYAGVGSGAVMVLCGANSFGEPKKGDKAVTQSRKLTCCLDAVDAAIGESTFASVVPRRTTRSG